MAKKAAAVTSNRDGKENETVFNGDVLAKLRTQNGYSQEDVEAFIGAGSGQLSRYERSAADPSLKVLKRLKNLFRVPADVFLRDDATTVEAPFALTDTEKELILALRRGDFQKLMSLASKK